MAINNLTFPFPIKGVNRLLARSSQAEGTAFDMMNVLPFDRDGRLRGAKRTGTSKLWSDPLGVDTNAVLLLDQVTFIGEESVVASTTIQDIPLGSWGTGNMNPALWTVQDQALGTASTATQCFVTGAVNFSTTVTDNCFLTTTTPIDTATSYTVTTGWGMANNVNGDTFALGLEVDASTYYGAGPAFLVTFSCDGTNTTCEFRGRDSTFTNGVDYFLGNVTISNNGLESLVVQVISTGGSRTARVTLNGVQVGMDCPIPAADAVTNLVYSLGNQSGFSGTGLYSVLIVGGGDTGDTQVTRDTKIVAVADRDIYVGDLGSQGVLATNGENKVKRSVIPQGCYSGQNYYIVDGVNIRKVNMDTATVVAYAATAGTAPTGTVCCMWRDRLIIAGPDQNFYASRQGVHTDWEFGLPNDPAGAWAGNASDAGHIGEPIVALMPMRDDLLGIGGDHSFHVVRGDLADGGSIDLVSDAIGILGPKAWCKDPEGCLYFLGTGGLFKWNGTGDPQNISDDKWNQKFAAINRTLTVPILVWDRDRAGCYIFLARLGADLTTAETSLWYDRRLDALYPVKFPVGHGPYAAIVYDGDGPLDRVMLLGGRDGYVRQMATALSDDGTAINAYVKIGPIPLGTNNNDGILNQCNITLGEAGGTLGAANFGCDVTIDAGLTAYDVTDGAATAKVHKFSRRYDGRIGRLESIRQKLRGVFACVTIADASVDKTFTFEQMSLDVETAGKSKR